MSELHIICKIGDSEYAIPGDDVYQMETYTGATPVPGTPPYVAGLVQIRQQILPVVDLRLRFGQVPSPLTLESRVIVLRLRERLIGLLVDSAREVQNIPPSLFRAAPEVLAGQSTGFVKSVAQLKNRIIMLLDSEKVIGQETLNG
jgi:purine-binding chemotaxis protein CheW